VAFSAVGSLGTNSSKTVGTTLAITCARSVAAGRILVVWAMWDTGSTLHPNITDSKGNIYTMIGWNSHGSVGLTALYACQVQVALTNTDTITLTGSNLAAKAMSVEEYAGSGVPVRWARILQCATNVNLGSDPSSISLSSLDSQEYLLLHLLGAEAPSTDAYTWDADYTQITQAGTTGGVADTNVTILGGYRIATLTDDTVDVTSDTADRDYLQMFTALCECTPYPTFPNTPLLDDFNRADEDPLSQSGEWETGTCKAGGNRDLRVASNVVARSLSARRTPPVGGASTNSRRRRRACDDRDDDHRRRLVYDPALRRHELLAEFDTERLGHRLRAVRGRLVPGLHRPVPRRRRLDRRADHERHE
jgi:hypothetical protein